MASKNYPADPHGKTRVSAKEKLPARLGARLLPSVLGGITGLAICVVILFVWRASSPRPAPLQPVAATVCTDLQHRDYGTLFTLLAPQLQQEGTQAQFAASQRQLDILRGPVTSCSFHANTQGNQATVTYHIQRKDGASKDGVTQFQMVSGVWRITAYDSSIVLRDLREGTSASDVPVN